MTAGDWVGVGWLILVFGILMPVFLCCMVMDELPRGFRWLLPVWIGMVRGIKYAILRVFYPERLDKCDRWGVKTYCVCNKCRDRRRKPKKAVEPKPATYFGYPNSLIAAETEVGEVEALEAWHQAYELGHSPEECDGIAAHPALYDDTKRRDDAKQHEGHYP